MNKPLTDSAIQTYDKQELLVQAAMTGVGAGSDTD